MTLQKIEIDLKSALKSGLSEEVGLLRMLVSALKNKEIELRPKKEELTEEKIIEVIRGEIKKRKESIEIFSKNNRQDLADKETKELTLLQRYLPVQLSDEEIRAIIAKCQNQAMGHKGKLIGLVMKETKGRADGNRVKELVEGI